MTPTCLYATRFYADDPFVWWEARGKTHLALSPLEIDRARPVARVSQVHGIGEFLPTQAKDNFRHECHHGNRREVQTQIVFSCRANFPQVCWKKLRRLGLKIAVSDQPFFPATHAQNQGRSRPPSPPPPCAWPETGLRRGIDVLKASKTDKRGFLHWGRDSPHLGAACAPKWMPPCSTPGARRPTPSSRGGLQGCDPHERGHGPSARQRSHRARYFSPACRQFLLRRSHADRRARTRLRGRCAVNTRPCRREKGGS